MESLLLSLALFFFGGIAALVARRGPRASRIGAGSAIAASLVGLAPAFTLVHWFLSSGFSESYSTTGIKLPMGSLALTLDLLSAVFLIPVLILVAVAALYGTGNGDGGKNGSHSGAHWFFYNMLAGGMVLTLIAADAFLFLVAWEVMSLAPFFLILLNGGDEKTKTAAWTYLVAAHLGALFLLGFFALLGDVYGGTLSFAAFNKGDVIGAEMNRNVPGGAGVLFIFALLGFGTKAGFMPLHIWLPEAHPAAPSHVSAVMSGAMIKMGVYGMFRVIPFLGPGESWWAYTLIAVGAFTGFAGIIQALVQNTIKRSLAFSSVENVGIICMALGIALLCLQNGHTNAAALAVTGALLHMINHALSKGLLFLCAGSVLHGAGTVTLRFLGGLHKRMPVVGWCFVLGGAAISALPPLNGFAGEFFIYMSMVFGGTAFAHGAYPEYSLVFWVCLFTLSGIGGFTLLCFARLFGMAFLGEARSEDAATAKNPRKNEITALVLLAAACVLSALAAPKTATVCHASLWRMMQLHYYAAAEPSQTLSQTLSLAPSHTPSLAAAPETYKPLQHMGQGLTAPGIGTGEPGSAVRLLRDVNGVFLLFVVFALGAYQVRRKLLRGKEISSSPTWDCGYVAPTARMQYTAGSFSRPAAFFMRTLLRQKFEHAPITEYFPLRSKAALVTEDWIVGRGYAPLFRLVQRVADWCKRLQHGRTNAYILYILVTLVALLAWYLR
ncbi:MAG: NAD(P)H-quinone oxidoreductase subunit 2, chloroplastic [Desulfovibrio sp.]